MIVAIKEDLWIFFSTMLPINAALIPKKKIAKLKAQAHSLYITEVSGNSNRLKLTMYEKAGIAITQIPKLIERYQGALKFQAAEAPYFLYERKNNKRPENNILKTVSYLLEDMKMLLPEDISKKV